MKIPAQRIISGADKTTIKYQHKTAIIVLWGVTYLFFICSDETNNGT